MQRIIQAVLLCSASFNAWANEISHLEPRFGLAAGYFDYEERDLTGRQINRETGALPGIAAGLKADFGHWFADLDFRYFDNDVEYDGETNLGLPVTSRTDTQIAETLLEVGVRSGDTGGPTLSLSGGAGFRWWHRDIRSTGNVSGVDEVYQWPFVHLGFGFERRLSGADTLSVDLRGWRQVNPRLAVDFKNDFDNATLYPDADFGGRVAVAWTHRFAPQKAVRVELWYARWELGASDLGVLRQNGVDIGVVYEPASESQFVGLSVAFAGWIL